MGGQSRPPAGYIGFTDIFGETAASQRADVGIGPYMTPANSCCPANFECRAFLPQPFKGSCHQFWCTITGGAYQIARRVSPCVRNICKSDSCLNRTAGCTPRPQAPLFSPIFSGKTEKIGPPEATGSCKVDTTSQSRLRRASSPGRGAFSAAAGDRSLRPFGPAPFTQGSFFFIGNARRRCPSGRGGGRGCV